MQSARRPLRRPLRHARGLRIARRARRAQSARRVTPRHTCREAPSWWGNNVATRSSHSLSETCRGTEARLSLPAHVPSVPSALRALCVLRAPRCSARQSPLNLRCFAPSREKSSSPNIERNPSRETETRLTEPGEARFIHHRNVTATANSQRPQPPCVPAQASARERQHAVRRGPRRAPRS